MNYESWNLSLYDVILLSGGCMAAGMAVGWLFYDSFAAGCAAAGILFILARPRYVNWRIGKRQTELLIQFRDILYAAASSVSAGRSMAQALEEAADFWKGTYTEEDLMMAELKKMVHQMKEAGVQDLDVLWDFARRSGLPDVADFVMVYENCRSSGANLVQAIDRAAEVIGDRITLEQELHTLMAQKLFEGRIIMVAPFGVVLFLKLSAPDFLEPLTADVQGRMISTMALLLIGAAWMITERVNRIEL